MNLILSGETNCQPNLLMLLVLNLKIQEEIFNYHFPAAGFNFIFNMGLSCGEGWGAD